MRIRGVPPAGANSKVPREMNSSLNVLLTSVVSNPLDWTVMYSTGIRSRSEKAFFVQKRMAFRTFSK